MTPARYDTVITGGRVIDPANGIDAPREVAIVDGRIAAVAERLPAHVAGQVIDASGQIVTPGLVDLHAPFSDYLPWFSVRSEYGPITPHHLLSHTAGIINGTDFSPDQRYEVWALRETETASPPGTYFHYSNVGYKALGLALERLLAKPYAQIIQERIFDPLGMVDSYGAVTHDLRPRLAVGYRRLFDDRPGHPGYPLTPDTWLETDTGDGCLSATPGDLAIYLRMLLNGGQGPQGTLISPQRFAGMTERVIEVPERDEDAAYGLGLATYHEDDHLHLTHSGGMVGYFASLLGDVTGGFGAVSMINSPGDAGQFTRYAVRLLRAARDGAPLPDPPTSDPTLVANAADYEGEFMSPIGSLRLVTHDGRLLLRHEGMNVLLDARGNDQFFVRHPDFAMFLLRFGRVDGEVVEVFHGPAWFVNLAYRGPVSFEAPAAWAAYPGHYRSHDPWGSNFRVVMRKGALSIIFPSGEEEALVSLGSGRFRVGADERSAERLTFDTVVEGEALRANYSCADYYRFFTP